MKWPYIKNQVFWDMMPHELVNSYWCFRGACCIRLHRSPRKWTLSAIWKNLWSCIIYLYVEAILHSFYTTMRMAAGSISKTKVFTSLHCVISQRIWTFIGTTVRTSHLNGRTLKGKVHPKTSHKGPEEQNSSTLSWALVLDGGGWATPCPGRFTLGKDPVPTV
jgi:hypothetical protein